MDYNQIKTLLDRYFIGETSIEEDNFLRHYFMSGEVSDEFKVYAPLFIYIGIEQQKKVPMAKDKKWQYMLASAAAIAAILLITWEVMLPDEENHAKELGTFNDPELAFKETQKALDLLSSTLNKGVESVQYLEEYDRSRKIIFKN